MENTTSAIYRKLYGSININLWGDVGGSDGGIQGAVGRLFHARFALNSGLSITVVWFEMKKAANWGGLFTV
jgi:hypothetical protein